MKWTLFTLGAAAVALPSALARSSLCSDFGCGDSDYVCTCLSIADSQGESANVIIAGQSYGISVSTALGGAFSQPAIIAATEGVDVTVELFAEGKLLGASTVSGWGGVIDDGFDFDVSSEDPVASEFTENGLHEITAVLSMNFTAFDEYVAANNLTVDSPEDGEISSSVEVNVIPGGLTLLPLICTLIIAVATQEVLVALTSGLFVGSFIRYRFVFMRSLWNTFEVYIADVLTDKYKVYTVMFSIFLSGLVGMMTRAGGANGLAEAVSKYASTPRLAQLSTYLSGWIIFFDDYANAMVVGNTMRPITDVVRVSREKLAFVVDATSAPIASLMPISAWIAYEVGQINDQLSAIGGEELAKLDIEEGSGFLVFLETIPSRYYPFVMLFFQLFLIVTGLEFGPMLTAERRSRYRDIKSTDEEDVASEKLEDEDTDEIDNYHGEEEVDPNQPDDETPRRWWNGLLIVVILIVFIIVAMVQSGISNCDCGDSPSARDIFGNTDPFLALIEGVMGTVIVTFIIYRIQYKLDGSVVAPGTSGSTPLISGRKMVDAFVTGMVHLMPAIFILILAWAFGDLMTDLSTPAFFYEAVSESVEPKMLPALTFILSALIALATGSSWSTMAIMFPLVSRVAFDGAIEVGDREIFLSTLSSVLAGSVFGDHCSPISDTTVLSSIATRCELQAHVTTQAPYAFFVGMLTLIFGDLIGTIAGIPPIGGIVICTIVTFAATMAVSAPVNSSTGRLDLFSRMFLALHSASGSDRFSHPISVCQEKAIIAESRNPTAQFDPLGRVLGGNGSAPEDYNVTGGFAISPMDTDMASKEDENPQYDF